MRDRQCVSENARQRVLETARQRLVRAAQYPLGDSEPVIACRASPGHV